MVFGVIAIGGGTLKASAISCRKDYFDKSKYTLTGNMAHDVAVIAKSQKGRTRADFGYTEGWCDEYCADCIENAGADSSIVAHGGTVADFEKVMRRNSAVTVTSPQEGVLIFFSNLDHVEIVTKVVDGVVFCAGGNNSGATGGMCKGERAITGWGTARCYLRPNYKNTNPPAAVTEVYGLKSTYQVGEVLSVSWPAASGATSYGISCAMSWGMLYKQESTSFTSDVLDQPGDYYLSITSYNSAGSAKNTFHFTVVNPTPADTEPPVITSYGITQANQDSYVVYCVVSDNVGISKVQFPTWTAENGQDDLIWYDGVFEPDGVTACVRVWRANHNNELGEYISHIYVWDAAGNQTVAYTGAYIEQNAPQISNVEIKNRTPDGYTISCSIQDENPISSVSFPTWTSENGQDDIIWYEGTIDGNTASCSISISNHNSERGLYNTHIYAYDIWGNSGFLGWSIWVPSDEEKRTVTYNANGGSGAPSSHTGYVNEYESIKLSSTKPKRNGYTFLGWATDAKATKAQYQPGKEIKPSKNITLYAVWKQNTYTLTYNANSGSGAPAKQTGSGNITLSSTKPTRSGYTFLGWATDAKATKAQYQPGASYKLTANVTFYAVWSKITYTLTYNANGGSGAPAKQTGSGNITLSSTKPTRSGYTFLGWATSSGATSAQYKPGASYNLSKNTTLYAVWKKSVYSLTYNANGGTGAPEKQTGNGEITLSKTWPTRKGYFFLGWATSAKATKEQYSFGDKFTLNKNVTLYAVWKKNPASDAEVYIGKPKTVDYRTKVTLYATGKNIPDGYKLQLREQLGVADYKLVAEGDNHSVSYYLGEVTSERTFQVRLVNKDGYYAQKDNYEVIAEYTTIKVKSGFFDKIIAFFKGLLGLLPSDEIKP